MTAEPTDAEIEAVLRAAPRERWADLAAAVRAVEAEPAERHVRWAGGEQVGTTMVDGVDRPVVQLPYPVYSDAAERLRAALGGVGAIVVFAWPGWDGAERYKTAADVATAPAADVARLVTSLVRGERFAEGTLADALSDGRLLAAARRLLAWHAG